MLNNIKKYIFSKPVILTTGVLISFILIFSSICIAKFCASQEINIAAQEKYRPVYVEEDTDTGTYGNSRNGTKVKLLEYTEDVEVEYYEEVLEEGYEQSEEEGNANTLENLQQTITESVLAEVEQHYGTVIKGAKGDQGPRGERGLQGQSGSDGKNGKQGPRGGQGLQGQSGSDGRDGKDGSDGKDGKNVYIVYSENADGSNYTSTPQSNSQYMGVATAYTQPINASDYTWTKYKELQFEYSIDNGVPTLIIK